MPEFVEAEAFRRTLGPITGTPVASIEVVDERLLRNSEAEADLVRDATIGESIDAARRIGKVVLADLSSGHTLAFGFGLRGRFVLDGRTSTPDGVWRDTRVRDDHVRLRLRLRADGDRTLVLEDQLRLATLHLDPDEDRLGVDVLAIDKRGFRELLARSDAAIKSLLMDQRRIAGIGNLIADEILYQGKIDPRRPASSIVDGDLDDLWIGVTRTRERVLDHGGSHHGVLIQSGARERGEDCPRCDVPIERVRVGGRTSYFCPEHQR